MRLHRDTFINGSMGVFAALLWAVFLVVSAYGMLHFLRYGMLALGGLRTIEMLMLMLMLLISSIVFPIMPRLLALAIHILAARSTAPGKLSYGALFAFAAEKVSDASIQLGTTAAAAFPMYGCNAANRLAVVIHCPA